MDRIMKETLQPFHFQKPERPNPPINGWAPGKYECQCHKCKASFLGDKRAVTCESCAYKEWESLYGDKPAYKGGGISKHHSRLAEWKYHQVRYPGFSLIEDSKVRKLFQGPSKLLISFFVDKQVRITTDDFDGIWRSGIMIVEFDTFLEARGIKIIEP